MDFVIDRLDSEYSRNRIGRSRYENGKSGMNMFKEFLRSKERGTYKSDGIYLGEISVELLEEYIEWRRDIKQNSDHTINHALTPILKACAYAAELHTMRLREYSESRRSITKSTKSFPLSFLTATGFSSRNPSITSSVIWLGLFWAYSASKESIRSTLARRTLLRRFDSRPHNQPCSDSHS